MAEHYIGLDFETYSDVDLFVCGLENYVSSPNFMPLIAHMFWLEEGTGFQASVDFTRLHPDEAVSELEEHLMYKTIVAHNAGFERRVLKALGLDYKAESFLDSAVVARVAGAAGKLEAAAPQLLGIDKLESGQDLIKLFSIPGKYQVESGSGAFDPRIIEDHPDEWSEFNRYCGLDARLSFELALNYEENMTRAEYDFAHVTLDMNDTGWHVDVHAVQEMLRRYHANLEDLLHQFQVQTGSPDLNLNSLKQMKEWCAERGVRATSFDEKAVAKMIARLEKRLESSVTKTQREGYEEVLSLLTVKQQLGGSSLKKLQVILDTVDDNGILRDQYLHAGAGQTLRTTGRSVQMQNLKRLSTPSSMESLCDESVHWTNEQMAENLRQVFTSRSPQGLLIVGDFASVESRGLAYLAGEQWKLDAYENRQDIYKLLASNQYDLPTGLISKEQRQFGKVGELSCGYGAGPDAVQSFASNMGVDLTSGEAQSLVSTWRESNEKIVGFWDMLDELIRRPLDLTRHVVKLPYDGLQLVVRSEHAPSSLVRQAGKTLYSLIVEVEDSSSNTVLRRVFHGVHSVGKDRCYFKPSSRKTGDLWANTYINPKTKARERYKLYGGKLAGILTQSFCRELFFQALVRVHDWTRQFTNVDLVGQFHDEIVLDWTPPDQTEWAKFQAEKEATLHMLIQQMSYRGSFTKFPLAAEVNSDYRYIK